MSKGPVTYSERVHFLCTPEQKEHLKKIKKSQGLTLRTFIDAHMGKFDHDLVKLEERMAVLEPEYLAVKKRIEEIRLEKKRMEDEELAKDKQVEIAHEKLLGVAKSHRNRVDLVSRSTFKIYAEMCGQTVEELQTWLEAEVKKKT